MSANNSSVVRGHVLVQLPPSYYVVSEDIDKDMISLDSYNTVNTFPFIQESCVYL